MSDCNNLSSNALPSSLFDVIGNIASQINPFSAAQLQVPVEQKARKFSTNADLDREPSPDYQRAKKRKSSL